MKRLALTALLAAAAAGLAGAKGEDGDPPQDLDRDAFTGLLVPLNATEVRAPESGFRISGWTSCCPPLKVMELVKDGTAVKEGEVIARFEFKGERARQWIEERLQRAKADQAQARIAGEQKLEGLRVELRRRKLEAELAALDVKKERAISRRQADLYRIQEQIADFEADAVRKRLFSAEQAHRAEVAYHDQNVARQERDLDRYAYYEGRMKLTAPHDGVVRHAYNSRERRKVQKGDTIMSGLELVSVAKDHALAVRFFVPEHRISQLEVGTRVVAVSPASGEELKATVVRVDFFPQELGFLMDLPTLPNAREKAFAVTAELTDPPEGLSAGTEVRVKLKAEAP